MSGQPGIRARYRRARHATPRRGRRGRRRPLPVGVRREWRGSAAAAVSPRPGGGRAGKGPVESGASRRQGVGGGAEAPGADNHGRIASRTGCRLGSRASRAGAGAGHPPGMAWARPDGGNWRRYGPGRRIEGAAAAARGRPARRDGRMYLTGE